MILSWMLYSVAVGLLLGAAAAAAERFLRLYGKAARWVWVGVLVAMVTLPAAGLFMPDKILAGATVSQTMVTPTSLSSAVWQIPERIFETVQPRFAHLDNVLLGLWIAGSAMMLLMLSWSWLRLARELRTCMNAQVDGIPVLVSPALGPAVVGFGRQSIVLPLWVLECDERVRALIVRHEQEHLRKGDQYLVLAGLLLVALLPWNVALWWCSVRLRTAVETDCDFRLLGSGTSLHAYSRLLLEVGTRLGSAPIAALAFSRSRSSLYRRIQLMTFKPRKRFAHAALAAIATLVLAVMACETPVPPVTEAESPALMLKADSLDSSIGSDGTVTVRLRSSDSKEASVELEPLVFIDGVRIHESVDLIIDTLSPDHIDRVEVVKGDAALEQYGESAANGVIHIYMKTVAQREAEGAPVN